MAPAEPAARAARRTGWNRWHGRYRRHRRRVGGFLRRILSFPREFCRLGRALRRNGAEEERDAHGREPQAESTRARERCAPPRRIQDRIDPLAQFGAADDPHRGGEPWRPALFVRRGVPQECRVVRGEHAGLQHEVVAGLFLEPLRLARGEPHQRVVPVDRAGELAEGRGQPVVAADVREFVQQREPALGFGPGFAACG